MYPGRAPPVPSEAFGVAWFLVSRMGRPLSVNGKLGPFAGMPTVPLVPAGTSISRRKPLEVFRHLTSIGPYGVGTVPSAQERSPVCGSINQVLYPAVTGPTPSTYFESAEVGPEAQPCAKLVPSPRPGVSSKAMYSQVA